MISKNLFAFYQDAYISGYVLTLPVIALLRLPVTLVVVLGIQGGLKFQPEARPLEDDEPGEAVIEAR